MKCDCNLLNWLLFIYEGFKNAFVCNYPHLLKTKSKIEKFRSKYFIGFETLKITEKNIVAKGKAKVKCEGEVLHNW
jgi:hypothetical protein